MKIKTRLFRNIVSLLLCTVLLFITMLVYNNNQNNSQISANTRAIELKETINDYQSVLNEFDNSTLTTKGTTTYFEGYKSLDINTSEIDYISEDDLEEIEQSTVKYNLSYDYEENIVTISALITMQDGSIEVEEIRGVGFINEDNEIDAVMNIDGEGILLSEMRDSGIIDNCGLFSRVIKKIAKKVAIVATVVGTAAIIVASAGLASAVIGVGVMTASAIGAATTIATYATVTAAIAAGALVTAEMWENNYTGIEITVSQNITYAKWSEKTKEAVADIVKTKKKNGSPVIYFHVTKYNQSDGPIEIDITNYYTITQMATYMNTSGGSSLTENGYDAWKVITVAFPGYATALDTKGMNHYHAVNSDKSHVAAGPDGYTIHSFFYM